MPSHAASEKISTVSPDASVEDALKLLKKEKITVLPVVGDGGIIVGVFSLQALFRNLLPVSVAMSDGIQLDIKIGAAPGIAKRLKKVEVLKVSDVMERKFPVVAPETPLWESVNLLVQGGTPLVIAEPGTGRYLGMISHQSMLDELSRMKDSEQ